MRILAASLFAATALAAPAAAQDVADAEIRTECLNERLCVLFGPGGNVAVHHGEDGNVMIDDKYAPLAPKLLAAMREVSDAPLEFVINTHYHGDHTGGNEQMTVAGGKVLAHENVRARIEAELAEKDAAGEGSAEGWMKLPVITFDSSVDLYWNGEQIDIVHVHHAHTDGDAIVWFRGSKVVHMGDTYFKDATWPYVDLAAGGSIDGVIAAVRGVLDGIDEGWTVIPGHGPIATHADLHAYHDMLVGIRAGVAEGVAAGESLEAVQARDLTAPYAVGEGFITRTKFIEAVYKSLRGETDYSPR